ncbi:HAD family hydrolase [Sorangium sp. So ce394]|uniref:HAD family hydrolase n=1 Tax=Sorangium sp. So ce394 TaxID=3133310 RepID=UPI003F5C9ED1
MEALRLIAFDLDGTLLRTDGSISARTRSALAMAEAAGLTLMPVTARPPRRARQVAARTGLRGTAICSNGGLVYDLATDSVLRQNLLSAAAASALIESLRGAIPGVAFAIEAGVQYGCEHGYVIPSEHPNDRDDPRMRRGDALALCREGVTKLIVQHAGWPLEALLRITRAHAGALASVTHSGSAFVEVAAAGVTKALALEKYCAEHGIAAGQVIAFGDMPNDLPMLGWAGHGVAVANAHPEVLAAADEITSSNDDDGVAAVLERLARAGFTAS